MKSAGLAQLASLALLPLSAWAFLCLSPPAGDATGEVASRAGASRVDAFASLAGEGDAAIEGGDEDPSIGRTRVLRRDARIGPQPWPTDLPVGWPRPDDARVLADSRRNEGDRLILADLPGPPERALARYRDALHALGYAVERTRTRRFPHALHARGEHAEAVLTFFERDARTRVEILLLAGDAV